MIHSARPTVTPVANNVFCCFVLLDLKSGDVRTDGGTDSMCEYNDTYWPWLWVGRVDQFYFPSYFEEVQTTIENSIGYSECKIQDVRTINDPLGQTHSPASQLRSLLPLKICFVLRDFEKRGRTDGRTTCAKTMIPTGHDCGSAEWIKILFLIIDTMR